MASPAGDREAAPGADGGAGGSGMRALKESSKFLGKLKMSSKGAMSKVKLNTGAVSRRMSSMKIPTVASGKKAEERRVEAALAAQAPRASEREEKVLDILSNFKLDCGRYHTAVAIAKSGDDLLGGKEDAALVSMTWYRCTADNDLIELEGVTGGYYQPTVDDVGCRLLCQARDIEHEENAMFAEAGPIEMDPKLGTAASTLVEGIKSGTPASFPVSDALEIGEGYTLEVSKDVVRLLRAGDGDAEEIDTAACAAGVEVDLAPVAVQRFSLRLGPRANPHQLNAEDNKERDKLALVIRELCGTGDSTAAGEAAASAAAAEVADEATHSGNAEPGAGATAARESEEGEESDGGSGDGAKAKPPPPPPRADGGSSGPSAAADELLAKLERVSKKLAVETAARARSALEIQVVSDERDSLRDEVASLQAVVANLKDRLQASVAETTAAKSEAARASDEAAALKQRLSETEALLKAERDCRKQVDDDLVSHKRASKDTLQSLEAQLAAANDELASLRKKGEGQKSLVAARTASLEAAEARAKKAEAAAASAKAMADGVSATAAELEANLSAAKAEAASATDRASAAEAEAAGARAKASELEARFSEAKTAADAAIAHETALREAKEAAEKAAAAVEAQVESLQTELEATRDELDELTAQHNASRRKAESLSRDMARIMAGSGGGLQVDDVAKLQKDKKSLTARVTELEATVSETKSQLEAYEAAFAQQVSRVADSIKGAGAPHTPGRNRSGSGDHSAGAGFGGGSGRVVHTTVTASDTATGKRNEELQRLANDLYDQLSDKEQALEMAHATKTLLAERIRELETQLAEARGTSAHDEAADS